MTEATEMPEPPVVHEELLEEDFQPIPEPLQEASPEDKLEEKLEEEPPNASMQYATSGPRTTGTPDTVTMPPGTGKTIRDNLGASPNIDLVVSEKQHNWAKLMQESMYHLPMEDMYVDRLAKQGASFTQSVNYNNTELRGRSPAFKKQQGIQTVEGERALIQLISHLGVGGLFRAPMWNSGFWVTFKPSTESELLELNRVIAQDKIQAGRWSYGLALSNTIVYTLDRVIDFAIAHVYNTSIKADELQISDIRQHLAPQDINSFIWGFLCACYPSGFHYSTPCVNNPTTCQHVTEANLNVSKLCWTDNSELTDWQKQHMASSTANSKSLESVKRYREEMKALHSRRVVLNAGSGHELAFTIKTPTVVEYIDQGHRWIGGIVESVNSVLAADASTEVRNAQVNKITKATTLCQYIHWIESIEYGDLSQEDTGTDDVRISKIIDRATIEETLKQLSATDSIRDGIIDEVLKYINDSTISVIGIPAFDCPACGKPQEGEVSYPKHVSVIPLDLIQVFFALLGQRLNRIEVRSSR